MTAPKDGVLKWVAGVTGSVLAALIIAAMAGMWGAAQRAEASSIRVETKMTALEVRITEVREDVRAIRDGEAQREAGMVARWRADLEAVEERCQQSIRAATLRR